MGICDKCSTIIEDLQQCSMAGARGVSYLLALAPRASYWLV